MKSFQSHRRTVGLAFIVSLTLVALQAAAQSPATAQPLRVAPQNSVQSVQVVNTTKNPVPTTAQGTTTISGNVNVTNASLPVNGSVSITNNPLPISGSVAVTNSSLPVTGTVAVSNLPLDANGNVRTSVAPDTTQYQFQTVIGQACAQVNYVPTDFCTANGATVESVLNSYSSQGYEVFAASPFAASGNQGTLMVYTLRK